MSDKNLADVLIALIDRWNVWYTLILVLAVLLVTGFINVHTITEWINAGAKVVPKL